MSLSARIFNKKLIATFEVHFHLSHLEPTSFLNTLNTLQNVKKLINLSITRVKILTNCLDGGATCWRILLITFKSPGTWPKYINSPWSWIGTSSDMSSISRSREPTSPDCKPTISASNYSFACGKCITTDKVSTRVIKAIEMYGYKCNHQVRSFYQNRHI